MSTRAGIVALVVVVTLLAGLWWPRSVVAPEHAATNFDGDWLVADAQPAPMPGAFQPDSVFTPVQRKPQPHPKIAEPVLRTLADLESRDAQFEGLRTPLVNVDARSRLQVYVETSSVSEAVLAALEAEGLSLEITDAELAMVQGWVPIEQVAALARLPDVRKIDLPDYGTFRSGSVVTEGDGILLADQVRQTLGIDGQGVRVGVIADGADAIADAVATGDVPPEVTVYGTCNAPTACNEGTATLEIVHDVAPGAELAMGAAITTMEFRQRVVDLAVDFQAHVIVDDIGFYTEPYFLDGVVAQRVAEYVDDIVFVSAAGNEAQQHYEADFQGTAGFGAQVHDFGGGDTTVDIQIPAGRTICPVLQWNDPAGAASNDYDMYLLNESETEVLCQGCSSTGAQSGSQDPIESFCYTNESGGDVVGKLFISQFSGEDRRIEFFIRGVGPGEVEHVVPAGSVFGHPSLPGVISVAAVSASDPGHDTIRLTSSRGPSRIDFPSLQTRATPSVTGIDGVSISGAGGYGQPGPNGPLFFGTSAAAPHVAAIAALVKQAAPAAGPDAIAEAITATAIDLGTLGADTTFGAGRVDALSAVLRLDSDDDGDGVDNATDNCPLIANPGQENPDGDAAGSACDVFPNDPSETVDTDGDGTGDNADVFPQDPEESLDSDSDLIGDNADPAPFDPVYPLAVSSDFDRNLHSDVLLRSASRGLWRAFYLDGFSVSSNAGMAVFANSRWQHQATADFDGDKDADVLVRSTDGEWTVFEVEAGEVISSRVLNAYRSPEWQFVSSGDFDADGTADLLVRKADTGVWRIFRIENLRIVARPNAALFAASRWRFVAADDFDGDRDDDVLLRNSETGVWRIFEVEGGMMVGHQNPGGLFRGEDWQFVTSGDFDRDGTADLIMRSATNGGWRVFKMSGLLVDRVSPLNLFASLQWRYQTSGDLDADGDVDLLLRRSADGLWRAFEIENRRSIRNETPGRLWGTLDYEVRH